METAMKKSKLMKARLDKGLTQQQVAEKMFIDVSNYNRRETGQMKLSNEEWEKLSEILEVPVEEIYESEDSSLVVFKDNAIGNYLGTNHVYSVPEHLLETQKKYIEKLELEIKVLKDQLKASK